MQPNIIAQSAHSAGQSHTSRDANQWNWNEQHQIGLYNYIVCVYKKNAERVDCIKRTFYQIAYYVRHPDNIVFFILFRGDSGKRWVRRDYEISYSFRQYMRRKSIIMQLYMFNSISEQWTTFTAPSPPQKVAESCSGMSENKFHTVDHDH